MYIVGFEHVTHCVSPSTVIVTNIHVNHINIKLHGAIVLLSQTFGRVCNFNLSITVEYI